MPAKEEQEQKRTKVSQTEFPRESLAKALSIAEAIWENFAGKGAAPHDIAMALDLSPTSGSWRNLCGTSIAYGLTSGGYAANTIELTDLGRRIVAPTSEGDDVNARVEAILQPRVMGEFFHRYDKAKFPKENIAENVLISLGVPKDRAAKAVELVRENGIYSGVLRETKTGLFVALGSPAPQVPVGSETGTEEIQGSEDEEKNLEEFAKKISGAPTPSLAAESPFEANSNVFVSHGKNKKIVNQLKELLTFGKFNPIVSVEKETASIPVPEKVFEDMRQCSAARSSTLTKKANSLIQRGIPICD